MNSQKRNKKYSINLNNKIMNKKNEQIDTADKKGKQITRPPVVVVMGHVDHGKSTLLDYIRKTNIAADETGGITQNISAYEVKNKNTSSLSENKEEERLITFIDTPGHEAFSQMRNRGAQTADIAILVVSAEDSVKAQTIEAYQSIVENKIPYIVAINKIDKPNANIDKTKMDLSEKGIYLEGMGGDIPFVAISAKEGTGVDELLDMIILVSDLQEFKGDPSLNATGVVIEANRDPKRGISATCIIKNGVLKSGMYIASGTSLVSTRIIENFKGEKLKEATFSSPISVVGFDSIPEIGNEFVSFDTKKEAEAYVSEKKSEISLEKNNAIKIEDKIKTIPLIIKADVSGSIEAIKKEIEKLNTEDLCFKITNSGVGAIGESDLKMASINKDAIVVGFNTKIDSGARDVNEVLKVNVRIFQIIYKLTDWLKEVVEDRRPKVETIEVMGSMKILKSFGSTKNRRVVGGKVLNGKITLGSEVRIMRRDFELGKGKIVELQQNKTKVKEVGEGLECGVLVESKVDISAGDVLEAFTITVK